MRRPNTSHFIWPQLPTVVNSNVQVASENAGIGNGLSEKPSVPYTHAAMVFVLRLVRRIGFSGGTVSVQGADWR